MQVRIDRAGREYRKEVTGREESADKSAKWICADSEVLATEEEAETAGGAGGGSKIRTATAWGTQEIRAGEQPGVMTAGGSKTGKATSAADNKAGAGGRHGARYGVRERVARRREKPAGNSSGVGGNEGGRNAYGVAGKSSGVEGKEGGSKSYEVVENHGEDGQGV